jgi:hypothetical protein
LHHAKPDLLPYCSYPSNPQNNNTKENKRKHTILPNCKKHTKIQEYVLMKEGSTREIPVTLLESCLALVLK